MPEMEPKSIKNAIEKHIDFERFFRPKRSQHGTKMGPKREPLGPKWKPKGSLWVQNGAQMGALGTKWEPKRSEEDPRRWTTAPDPPKVTKLRPKWLPNRINMEPE